MAWIYQSNQPKEDRVIRTVRIGDKFPDPIHNGISMPVDSVVSTLNRNGPLYRLVAPMCWLAGDGKGQRLDGFHLNTLLWLKQLPSGEEMELPALSTTQFRWRLRDAALASAERSGVNTRPVIEMCQQFGADVPMLRPGEVVANRIDLAALPVGVGLLLRPSGQTRHVGRVGGGDRRAPSPHPGPEGATSVGPAGGDPHPARLR
jgi:hypothetical protein